jgi:predicted nucleotidyltransferase
MQARRKARSRVQSRQEVVERLQTALPTLRERYGVRRLALYGSFQPPLRDEICECALFR